MKILTNKAQKRALKCIDNILELVKYSSDLKVLAALDELAELTYVVGGLEELKKRDRTEC